MIYWWYNIIVIPPYPPHSLSLSLSLSHTHTIFAARDSSGSSDMGAKHAIRETVWFSP